MRNADAEAELIAVLAPFRNQRANVVAHLDGHLGRAQARLMTGQRIIEQDHDAVAGKALDGSRMLVDETAERGMVLAQHRHHFLGLGGLRERGETAQVAKQHGNGAAMALQHAIIPR